MLGDVQQDLPGHPLQRQRRIGQEAAAQHGMAVQHRLPGLSEACGIQAMRVDAKLGDIGQPRGIGQAVEQHARLHGRQRIEVRQIARGQGQAVQLRLRDPRQREVRGRHPLRAAQAVVDQALQLLPVAPHPGLHIGGVVAGRAEGGRHHQLAVVDAAIEGELVRQRRRGVGRHAAALGGRQPFGRAVKACIELPQVVEDQAGLGQGPHGLPLLRRAQVLEHAMAQAVQRHLAQALLDALERVARACARIERHREDAGEPAHGARDVHTGRQLLAAMALQVHEDALLPAPRAQGAPQGGQQDVVDLRPVGRRHAADQGLGALAVQPQLHAGLPCQGVGPLGTGTGQDGRHLGQRLPEGQLAAALRGMGLQRLRPALVAGGLVDPGGLQALQPAGIGRTQVFEQDAPGDPIDDQMVGHQQQAPAAVAHLDAQPAQQRPVDDVQAALRLFAQGLDRAGIPCLAHPEQCLQIGLGRACVGLLPGALRRGAKAQAQAVVPGQQVGQGLAQRRGLQRLRAAQQQGLVPVGSLRHVRFEELRLNGQQGNAPLDRGVLRQGLVLHGLGHTRQFGNALPLEQLAWRQLPAKAAQARDDLQAQDGITTQREEVVAAPHPLQAQHLGPDTGQQRLQFALGRLAGGWRAERGQGLPVQLAVGVLRQLVQHHDGARHHVVGQYRGQAFAHFLLVQGPAAAGRHIGQQPRARRSRAGHDHGLAHIVQRQQLRLHLAQLDAQAADLDLVVHPPQVLQLALCIPAHQVARAVESCAIVAEGVGDKALRAEPRPVQVAARQQGAAYAQLAGHAQGHGAHPLVHHPHVPAGQGPAYRKVL